MVSEEIIKQIVENNIRAEERIGDSAGGSGHSGFQQLGIETIRIEQLEKELLEVICHYTIITETEFTYYPDNPPYENKYLKKFFMKSCGTIVKEEAKMLIHSNMDIDNLPEDGMEI